MWLIYCLQLQLLLHKKELNKIKIAVNEKGNTLIPLSIYFKNGLAKLSFALAKGKKNWDKRIDKMNRDVERQIDIEPPILFGS